MLELKHYFWKHKILDKAPDLSIRPGALSRLMKEIVLIKFEGTDKFHTFV